MVTVPNSPKHNEQTEEAIQSVHTPAQVSEATPLPGGDDDNQDGDPEGYRESEDEDWAPENEENEDGTREDNEDASDNGEPDGDDDEVSIKDYAKLQGSGGLIKSRAQRKAQESEARNTPTVVGTASIDVDELWAEMNGAGGSTKPGHASRDAPQEEYVDIERTFKFAGNVTTERKRVLKSSAEGQQYLREKAREEAEVRDREQQQQQREKERARQVKPGGRGPVKRKMSLLEEYQQGKTRKISTLEKSRLDWLGFVDNEGIKDDLTQHNKAGYLDKQGFLARVEQSQDLRARKR